MKVGTIVYVKYKGCRCRGEVISHEHPYYIVQLYGSGLELSFYEDEIETE